MRNEGSRLNIIIVAEGALDRDGKAITAVQVQDVVKQKLHYDTRVTVLGHVQRGGSPSAFDRLLGCRMGAEAVLALMEMTPESEPCVVSIDGNAIVRVPLMQCVHRTQAVQKAMETHDWNTAVRLRGRSFQRNLETYRLLTKLEPKSDMLSDEPSFNVAVINVGAPAGGMNAVVRSFVRMGIYRHCKVYGVKNSFEGLANEDLVEMSWKDVNGWVMHGGSFLGTKNNYRKKYEPSCGNIRKIQNSWIIDCRRFRSILLIAYHSCLMLSHARSQYPSLRIPLCVIPCTISNNVPGTSISLGSDTAVNEICAVIDKIKQSATALASGADNAYIFEEKFDVGDIIEDVKVIARKMRTGVQRYLIVRGELANKNYTTQFVNQLFAEEGRGQFSTRINVLGHAQQGGNPAPFDRNMGTKLAANALEFILAQAKKYVDLKTGINNATTTDTATLLGLKDRRMVFTPVEELAPVTDFEHRLPKDQWWMRLRPLLRILSKHDSIYETEAFAVSDVENEFN
ncbi:6-phosphofructokinase [Dirofilaria immitis]|nr:6-phosphofructokinase [Dirofilaria immitis]